MSDGPTVKVTNSFDLSTGILVFLQHSLDGLKKGTRLFSEKRSLVWEVEKRIMYFHTADVQKIFANETTEHWRLHFSDLASRETSINAILQQEKINIFEYQILGLGHALKPDVGDVLAVL